MHTIGFVLGQPLPNNEAVAANNWDQPGEFTFVYEMGMAPSIDVELSGKLGVSMPVVEVDDASGKAVGIQRVSEKAGLTVSGE